MKQVDDDALRLAAARAGFSLIATGMVVLVILDRVVRYLWSRESGPISNIRPPPIAPNFVQAPVVAITCAMVLVDVFAFFAVTLRMV